MKDSQSASLRARKKPKKFKNTKKAKAEAALKVVRIKKDADVLKAKARGNLFKNLFNFDANRLTPFFFGLLIIITALSAVVLFSIQAQNNEILQKIEEVRLQPLDYKVQFSPYPSFDRFTVPEISAQSAIIIDSDSQIALYSKNPEARMSVASITKLMTALVALEFYDVKSILTIYTPVVEGSYIGFYKDEQYFFEDLLYAMFLPSSNEAAYAIAQNYPGGVTAFVAKMNERSQSLGLNDTHFNDPAGLDDDYNFSTVSDLAHLASIIAKNKILAGIASTRQKNITDVTGKHKLKLSNLNKLLGQDGVNGIKTGTTAGAGEVLITSKQEKLHTFIIVVMKSDDRFSDTKTLLSLISNNIKYSTPRLPESWTSLKK